MPPAASSAATADAAAATPVAASSGLPTHRDPMEVAGARDTQHGFTADPASMDWWDALPMVVPDSALPE